MEVWEPQVGMRCGSCFFRYVTTRDMCNISGSIILVGTNFLVIRTESGINILIKKEDYSKIETFFKK